MADKKDPIEPTAVSGPESGLDKMAVSVVSRLVDVGIDGLGPLESATGLADKARTKHGDVERAVDALVENTARLAATGGFLTGVGGFATLPVAMPVNIAEFYVLATRMVAGIAHLRGYDVSRPEVRSAVLLTLVGADSRSLLTKANIAPTGRLADLALRQLPAPALMVLNKAIGFRLLSQVGKKTLGRLGRGVPLVGGVVGGGLDWWLLRKIATGARSEFVQR